MSAKMKDPPKPRPAVWDAHCSGCGALRRKGHTGYLSPHICSTMDVGLRPRARWGHEWAAVAWMAERELFACLMLAVMDDVSDRILADMEVP